MIVPSGVFRLQNHGMPNWTICTCPAVKPSSRQAHQIGRARMLARPHSLTTCDRPWPGNQRAVLPMAPTAAFCGQVVKLAGMTGIQPELWIDRAAEAIAFYEAAFGARVLHQVGEGDDIVAQLAVGDAAFWVSPGGACGPRFSPQAIGGTTGRTLLVADEPDAMFAQAVAAGATAAAEMADEHGWRLGRIFDPFGHEWEIGRPLGPWPP